MADKFQVVLDLVDNASGSIDKVKSKLVDLASNAGGMTKALGIAGLAVGAFATVALGSLRAMSTAALQATTQINMIGDAAIRLGLGVEELQTLTSTFRTFGLTAEQTYDALTDFTERVEDARDGSGGLFESLQKLGISLKNNDGTLKNNTMLFKEWLSAVSQVSDASERLWHGAQVSDGMRDVAASTGAVTGEYDKNAEAAENVTKITSEMVLAARQARAEHQLMVDQQQALTDASNASFGPALRLWDSLITKIAEARSAVAYFTADVVAMLPGFDYTPIERLIKLQRELGDAQKDLTETLANPKAGPLAIEVMSDRVSKLNADIAALKKSYPDLIKQVNDIQNPKNTPATGGQQNADQLKTQQAYLDRLQKATDDARVKAIASFTEQTKAELALTNQRLADEATATIEQNKITGDAVTEIWNNVRAQQASNTIAATKKISDYQLKQDQTSATRSRAVQSVIDGIAEQTRQIEAQTQTLATNSRQLEYQLELEKAINQAKAANNNKDLDSVTINKIKNELAEKHAATLQAEAVAQDKDFQDTLDGLKRERDQAAAITDEQRNLLEVKNALLDKEKEYKRALTDTEREQLTNSIVSKQKAEATAQLAQQNADEIQRIYTTAAESIQGAFSDFFFDVMQGNLSDLADSFKRTIDRMVADMLAANLFKMVGGIGTGTAGESNLSGFFASIFGGISGRATGGPTTAGTPYWVGEEGPEIVIPSASSTVVPTDLSMAMASGSGSGGGTTVNNISIKALDSKSVIQLIEANDRDILNKLAEASQRYGVK